MKPTSMLAARIIKDDKFRLFDVECQVIETHPLPGEMTRIRFRFVGPRNQNVKTLVIDSEFDMPIYR